MWSINKNKRLHYQRSIASVPNSPVGHVASTVILSGAILGRILPHTYELFECLYSPLLCLSAVLYSLTIHPIHPIYSNQSLRIPSLPPPRTATLRHPYNTSCHTLLLIPYTYTPMIIDPALNIYTQRHIYARTHKHTSTHPPTTVPIITTALDNMQQ